MSVFYATIIAYVVLGGVGVCPADTLYDRLALDLLNDLLDFRMFKNSHLEAQSGG